MTIQEAVAEKISKSGESVAKIVIEELAEIEIRHRVDTITKAIHQQEKLEREFKKINRNDIITYSDGQQMSVMSKTRFDEIKKVSDKLEQLTKAIDSALTLNSVDSYTKLSEVLKKLDAMREPKNVDRNKTEGSGENE